MKGVGANVMSSAHLLGVGLLVERRRYLTVRVASVRVTPPTAKNS